MNVRRLVLILTCLHVTSLVLLAQQAEHVTAADFVGDWVNYLNGPAMKAVMHIRQNGGALSGYIDWPASPTQSTHMDMNNIKLMENGLAFDYPHPGSMTVLVLTDDRQKIFGMGGVWEHSTTSTADKHPCAKPIPDLRLDPDIQEILDGIKPKSASEANINLWCGSAADIDALKELLVSGSIAELRATRKALVDLDRLQTLCPWNPVTFTEEQKKAHARCQQRIIDQWGRAFTSLQEKMKSLVPGPDGYPPLNTVDFVGDLVPILKKQAQVEENATSPK